MTPPEPTPWLKLIPPYSPGLSKEEIARKHGIAQPIKLASNENPLGPSPLAIAAIEAYREQVHLYPDPAALELRHAAAAYFKCEADQIIAGNGSDEIIDFICRAFISPGDEVIIPACTFSYYQIAAMACGAAITITPMSSMTIDLDAVIAGVTARTKLIFIANPNNPTGTYLSRTQIEGLIQNSPSDTIVVIDEAYAVFARADDFASAVSLTGTHDNLLVMNTLSKSHGLAGLRVGFGIAGPCIMDKLWRIKPPFNLNMLAIKAGAAALTDEAFLRQSLAANWQGLDYLAESFSRMGLDYVPSQTNFMLVHLGSGAKNIYEHLLEKGIITRYMGSQGLADYLRVSIGLPEENQSFIGELTKLV